MSEINPTPLYPFCPFTDEPCPAGFLKELFTHVSEPRRHDFFVICSRAVDTACDEIGELHGAHELYPDIDPVPIGVPRSEFLTDIERGLILNAVRACVVKRCTELSPPPGTS
jgi:hypothetical protein